jgi:hypothetical protein
VDEHPQLNNNVSRDEKIRHFSDNRHSRTSHDLKRKTATDFLKCSGVRLAKYLGYIFGRFGKDFRQPV